MHDADTEVRDGGEARNRINFFGQCAAWRAGARRTAGRGGGDGGSGAGGRGE
jgi:hypothetical protein